MTLLHFGFRKEWRNGARWTHESSAYWSPRHYGLMSSGKHRINALVLLAAAQVSAGGRGGDRVLPLQHDPRYPLHHLRVEGTAIKGIWSHSFQAGGVVDQLGASVSSTHRDQQHPPPRIWGHRPADYWFGRPTESADLCCRSNEDVLSRESGVRLSFAIFLSHVSFSVSCAVFVSRLSPPSNPADPVNPLRAPPRNPDLSHFWSPSAAPPLPL